MQAPREEIVATVLLPICCFAAAVTKAFGLTLSRVTMNYNQDLPYGLQLAVCLGERNHESGSDMCEVKPWLSAVQHSRGTTAVKQSGHALFFWSSHACAFTQSHGLV